MKQSEVSDVLNFRNQEPKTWKIYTSNILVFWGIIKYISSHVTGYKPFGTIKKCYYVL